MITKQFRIPVALLGLGAMASVAVSGGQVAQKAVPSQPLQKVVYLQVADLFYNHPDRNTYLKFVNSTHSTIPRGTLLYWELRRNSNFKEEGSKRLTRHLTPGESETFAVAYIVFGLPAGEGPITAKVWYVPDTEQEKKPPLPTQQNPPIAPAPRTRRT